MTTLTEFITEHPFLTGATGVTVLGVLGFAMYHVINYFENREYKKQVEAGIQNIMETQRYRR